MPGRWWMLCAALALLIGIAALGVPTLAAPDGPNLPTPTPFPVENVEYSLSVVGGQPETFTFADPDQGGFTFGSTTVTSQYPRGMTFTLRPASSQGAIRTVTLLARYDNGSGTRAAATWDADQQAWIARLWDTGGIPAWVHFAAFWRVTDASGASAETGSHNLDYADPTRQWFRAESDHTILYWFGLSEDDPDRLARAVLEAVEATQPRRVDGFGRPLSYLPVSVVYGSREAIREMYGSGTTTRGFASYEIGMSVLSTGSAPLDDLIDWLRFTVTHEIVHLYQFDVIGGMLGPMWWVEGQANWFSLSPGLYDDRLRRLGALQKLPTLTGEISLDTVQADGLPDLGYDMGASFINWLLTHYGGMPTHREIVARMAGGANLYEAVEQVTGQTFFDLQNEWRAYLGLPPFAPADLNPAAALEPVPDPLFAVGDRLTLPDTPAIFKLGQDPQPDTLLSGSCFAGTQVKVLALGRSSGVDYYQIDCMGMVGWVTGDQIAGASRTP